MAQVEVLITSGRVTTHVRGRIMRSRFNQSSNPKPEPKSKERRRVCVLTARGGNELENWNMSQPCFGRGCFHVHQTREAVEGLVRDGILKWVGAGKNVAAYSYGRTWKGVPSGPNRMKVMQLV